MIAWTKDPRCRIGLCGLRQRLERGVPAEEAIATPGHELEMAPDGAWDTKLGASERKPPRRKA